MSTCARCGKHRSLTGRCGCGAIRRGWGKTAKGQTAPTPGVTVVHRANRSHKWCSCGALIRDGKCVSATCGKSA